MTNLENKITKWFKNNRSRYNWDNPTRAAEACAFDFNRPEWLDDECHPVWEIALKYTDEN